MTTMFLSTIQVARWSHIFVLGFLSTLSYRGYTTVCDSGISIAPLGLAMHLCGVVNGTSRSRSEEEEEPLARDELFSKTDVMILPSSAP